MIGVIAARELRSLFASPLAWSLLGVTQFLLAWRFLQLLDEFQLHLQPLLVQVNSPLGVTDLVVVRFLGDPALLMLLLLVIAVLAMRLLAEERRSGTLALLFSSPVSATQIVLGKYLGGLAFVLILVGLWSLMPLSLLLGSELDLGRLAAALLGLSLLAAGLTAVATYLSSLSAHPGAAAVAAFGAGLLLMLMHWGAGVADGGGSAFEYLSSLRHYDDLLTGTVSSVNLIYFALLIVGFLGFTVRRLDALRVQP
jgi:ABC-2 type transport system permease protein